MWANIISLNRLERHLLSKLRLLVADDEVLVRQGLCGLLALEPDFEVVGQASNGAEAIEQALRLQPDIVLMDIQMPVMNGVQATRELRQKMENVRIVMLTTFSDDALVVQAVQNGAHGYLLKDSGGKQLAAAIRTASIGYMTLNSDVAGKLLHHATPAASPAAGLTAREREVLSLLSKGRTNKEISKELQITEKTVRDHVSNILAHLNLRDRTQAALWAQQNLP